MKIDNRNRNGGCRLGIMKNRHCVYTARHIIYQIYTKNIYKNVKISGNLFNICAAKHYNWKYKYWEKMRRTKAYQLIFWEWHLFCWEAAQEFEGKHGGGKPTARWWTIHVSNPEAISKYMLF